MRRHSRRPTPRLDVRNRYNSFVKHLLLDLDDTLLDYSGGVDGCWAASCAVGCADGTLDAEALSAAVLESRRWFWDDPTRHRHERVNMLGAWTKVVGHALETLGHPDPSRATAIATEFARRRRVRMRLFPEAMACLTAWRDSGLRLGLVTNGDASQQRDKIARHGLAEYFGVIVIEGEFGAGKPDAAVYEHALHVLGARTSTTCMVGDNLDFDVAGAQALGMRGIWINRTGIALAPDHPVRPDHIIESLTELTPLLRQPTRSEVRPASEATRNPGDEKGSDGPFSSPEGAASR
jgi:putative hydrolase of the HAD superfamily